MNYPDTLRALAAFVESNPHLPAPEVSPHGGDAGEPLVRWHLNDRDDWAEVSRQIIDRIGGHWTPKHITTFSTLDANDTDLGCADMFVPRYDTQPVTEIPQIDHTAVLGLSPAGAAQ